MFISIAKCYSPTPLYVDMKCHKISIISPGLIFVQKAFLLGLFSKGLIIEGILRFKMAWA